MCFDGHSIIDQHAGACLLQYAIQEYVTERLIGRAISRHSGVGGDGVVVC